MEDKLDISLLVCSLLIFSLIFSDVLRGVIILLISIILNVINKKKVNLEIPYLSKYIYFGISSIIMGVLVGSYGGYPLTKSFFTSLNVSDAYISPTTNIVDLSNRYSSFLLKIIIFIYLYVFFYSIYKMLKNNTYSNKDKIIYLSSSFFINLYVLITYYLLVVKVFTIKNIIILGSIISIYFIIIYFNRNKLNKLFIEFRFEIRKLLYLIANCGLSTFTLFFTYSSVNMGRLGGSDLTKVISLATSNLLLIFLAFLVIYKRVTFFRTSDYVLSEGLCTFYKD